jgi:glycine oxidase
VDVIVIGAGVIGLSIADALARRRVGVTVLEMRSPGRGASFASAGILAPYTEAHHDSPLLPLATRSLEMFDAFVADVSARSGRTIEYARNGTLEVALGDDDVERLKSASSWLKKIGIQHEWLDATDVRTLDPTVTESALAGLLVSPHGHVGVGSLIVALTQSARLSGAVFESPIEATEIEATRDHIAIRAGDRRYTADAVVVAAGTWSQRVRVKGAPQIPVRPIRGQLLHLRWPSQLPGRVVWGPRCYTVPWRDGSLLVGATVEDVGFDERSTVAGVHALTAAVAELLPSSGQASIEDVRVGLRPAMPDGLPAIGASAVDPRITIATGHYRNGILLAPLTADVVCRRIVDGVEDPILANTRPSRFSP